MVTCCLRYTLKPGKRAEFEHYARTWMRLIEKLGGVHHGYYLPLDEQAAPPFSFPGLGREGPKDVAVALFSFASMPAYEAYRMAAAQDEECRAATAYGEQTGCFVSYERTFLRPLAGPEPPGRDDLGG